MDISQPVIPQSASPHPPHPPILSHFSLIYVTPPSSTLPLSSEVIVLFTHTGHAMSRDADVSDVWLLNWGCGEKVSFWISLTFTSLWVFFFFHPLFPSCVFLRFKRLVSSGFGPQWIKNWFPLETELVVRCYFNLCWGWSWHWWWCNKNKSPWYAAEITVYIFDLSSFSSLLKINLCISANLLTLTDSHLNFKCHSRLWLVYFPLLALLIH